MIDLDKYCSNETFRPAIQKPFSFGAYTYATNGHIIVRVDRHDDAPDGIAPMTPEGVDRALALARSCEFRHLPKATIKGADAVIDCSACDGRGHEHVCPDCDCECDECGGSGKSTKTQQRSISIGNALFNADYVAWLLELPNIEVETPTNHETIMKFRFDGGIGALMPLRRKYEVHLGDIDELQERML